MSGEAEPRRSVRATKGQHTKAFDELELVTAPKRRQYRKSKKAQEQEQEQEQEREQEQDNEQEQDDSQEPEADEVIRCVCGATEQDEDAEGAWISCETCFVWQHNVCVGVSSFEDEIPDNYWCEKCRPQDHVDLLEGISKGEKPWEARRKKHELEVVEKKKRRGGRKARAKRTSDPREAKEAKEELEKDSARSKSKGSPTPDAASPKDKKETAMKHAKRKSREDSHEADGKNVKLRRVSERDAVPVPPNYTPPSDLAASVTELPGVRVGPAKALKKSLVHVLGVLVKSQELRLAEGESEEALAEKHALQIERAVFDTHPVGKGQKEYSQQIKSLTFNLKNNPELCRGLLGGIHLPTTLAIMTSEQLASAELQRQTAEMRARAEKQSILYTSDTGVRVRKTHKGEEVVEDENMVHDAPMPAAGRPRRGPAPTGPTRADAYAPPVKRESVGGERADLKGRSPSAQAGPQQPSPSQPNFDINKVFSTVRSPMVGHGRKPSVPALNTNGPGFDPDVDRMLEDDNESPPYSPTEEAQDPDVVWRGSLTMSSIADFPATAKHVGGANFAAFGPWSKLVPKKMTVAGRIPRQSAIEYLCSLRYSNLTDIVVVSIAPAAPASRQDFLNLIDYFVSKKRYGVVGNKVAGNVRDTYLVPVPAGEGGHPEFMLNLVDNYIPKTRSEPMLLAVFVYRNEPDQLRKALESVTMQPGGATPAPGGPPRGSVSGGPAFSPATPQTAFPPQQQPPPPPPPPQTQASPASRPPTAQPQHHGGGALQSTTPVPIPQPPYANRPSQASPPAGASAPSQSPPAASAAAPPPTAETDNYQAQLAGQAVAHEVLGGLISAPTVQYILPQAYQMTRKEWEVIKHIYEREPRARNDLQYLGALLEKEGKSEDKPGPGAESA